MLLGHVEEREFRTSDLECSLVREVSSKEAGWITKKKRIGILNFGIRKQIRRNLKVDIK